MNTFSHLSRKIAAMGRNPSSAKQADLVEYIVCNIAPAYWVSVCDMLNNLPEAYTELSMRLGECGH